LAAQVDELQNALALVSEPTNVALLEQQLNELRETVEADEIAWEAERSSLTSSLEAQLRAKASAEEDRDFFKEQYTQASGYVSSVRAENDELVQRAEIADKRSVDGVRLVRETFSERVKVLEAELKKYKNLSTLLMEKDKRTGDAIRRRAGEEPQLRLRCMELEEQVEKLTFANRELEMDLIVLEAEKTNWEAAKVLADAEVMENETDAVSSMAEGNDDGGDEMVHRCQWRIDEKTSCESLFLNIEVS
jgi:putative IMPACT (imprinted ancient) family translation regulator